VGAVLVTGGTGTLGRHVVAKLVAAGAPVRVLSRSITTRSPMPAGVTAAAGDLLAGDGVVASVDGVGTIVHCASSPRTRGGEVRATRHLIDAARTLPMPPHLVYISIVGVDRVPLRYYREKLAAEELIRDCGLPWTVLRATQFHDLVIMLVRQLARSPIVLVPAGTSVQPVDAAEVAQRLVDLASGPPLGRVDDMGGPQVRTIADLARTYLTATHRRRLVASLSFPGVIARGYRQGGHLAPEHAVGRVTFEQYLARPSRPS
jgi:uncharacterized protein YbjT (DUF2867 family)